MMSILYATEQDVTNLYNGLVEVMARCAACDGWFAQFEDQFARAHNVHQRCAVALRWLARVEMLERARKERAS